MREEKEKLLPNTSVTRWLSNIVHIHLVTGPPDEGSEKSGSAVKLNWDVIPTSSKSSHKARDRHEDTKAQPVMLTPAANNHGRNRETLAQYKRKNESDEEPTFLHLTKLQTRTQPQPVLQPD
ncbi:hypothetical protein TSAR_003710 [Trichomalopsis sarcophagae]|uniref:Uncharacterized protein n=1 Tax=Trichomalopsis sarcophagae TaxID=543379 RepID=A0A232EHJ6_9HYME|nr:hypothetical protein TSAR_003710 [Trichomalopsis sarcophagae]